ASTIKHPPIEIPQTTWNRVTALFTWMAFPVLEQAPSLQYVRLLAAGCDHVSDMPIFHGTDVVFCTANGVHPNLRALGTRKALLVNVARGAVVDTDDLVAALNDGTIKGAALDVTDPEPLPPDHPLWTAKNIIITPHVSCNSTHCNERVLGILTENLKRRAQGKRMLSVVDRSLGY
ncbi:hypothetical protein CSHISOI_01145, partial [Colletotrichum shisoi]